MLAIITKMTLTQVSTWFANARRRLKKENKMTWVPRIRTEEDVDASQGSGNQFEESLDKKLSQSREEEEEEAEQGEDSRSSISSVTSSNGGIKRLLEAKEEPTYTFPPETSVWKSGTSQTYQTPLLTPSTAISTDWLSSFYPHHNRIQPLPQEPASKPHYQCTSSLHSNFLQHFYKFACHF